MVKNPLRKRILRELTGEFGKYLVIFLLLSFTIAFVSGFLVADGSMIRAYNESFEKYNVEYGNFRVKDKLNPAQSQYISRSGIRLYDNFYVEQPMDNDSTVRLFQIRKEVNLPCLMKGALPEREDEIAIDRMYADNNGLSVGDRITSGSRGWTVTGLIALPDYSCLFQDNNDTMFDSVRFGVALLSEEGFSQFAPEDLHYCYSWLYDTPPADKVREKDAAEEVMQTVNREAALESFIPRYLNQAINFTGEDMGGDRAMMIMLLYIIIAIMAFVFTVTIGNTITREASVIGTLLASGYTKNELVRHYMACPVLVCFLSAVVGNILGYTVLKDVCAGMYYGSYSLTTYVTIWNAEAFVLTTVVPTVMMTVITWLSLRKKLGLPPLKFLRRDLRKKQKARVVPLPSVLPFLTRFRLRVVFQNMGSYVILFAGILFANLLLMFGLLFPSALRHYQDTMPENMLSQNTTMLAVPADVSNDDRKLESLFKMMRFLQEAETENPDAEKFSAYSLMTLPGKAKSESIALYGVEPDSRYISADLSKDDTVLISSAYKDKYGIAVGDTVILKEEYEDKTYQFNVTGVYDYMGGLTLFLPRQTLNRTFDLGKSYFCGYFSDTPIDDIDAKYIGSVLDLTAMTKVSRQLTRSMGGMMDLVNLFSLGLFMALVYLLSKMIIEKNALSISMTKILGYSRWEIFRLYILPTSLVTVLEILASLPVEEKIMTVLFREVMMTSMSGWIPLYIAPRLYVQMAAYGIGAYSLVALLELRRIGKIPESEALKCVE